MTALEGIFEILKVFLWTLLNLIIEPLKNESARPFIIAFLIILAVALIIAFIIKKSRKIFN